MTFDLDEAIEAILPLELSLKINGQLLATRRPTVAEYSQLMGMEHASEAQALKLLGSLFEPPVDAGKFGRQKIQGMVVSYLAYFKSRALKNPMAIAEQVFMAVAAEKTHSNTTPPSSKPSSASALGT